MVTEDGSLWRRVFGRENSQRVRSQSFPQSLGAGEEMALRQEGRLVCHGRGEGVVPQCP